MEQPITPFTGLGSKKGYTQILSAITVILTEEVSISLQQLCS